MGLLKETLEFYRERRRFEREKKTLLNSRTDFALLERLVRKVNDNPNLKISVVTRDGARINIGTYDAQKRRDYEEIDGADYIDIS